MMEFFQVKFLFWPLILLRLLGSSKGVTLSVPPAGNCGDETTLTCQYTGRLNSYKWVKVAVGAINPANNPEKYRAENDTSKLKLIIKNTELSDSGSYSCSVNNVSSRERNLVFECKASIVKPQVGKDKKLTLTIDRLYPIPAAFAVITTPKITGSHACSNSSQYPGYQRCVWTSQCLTAGTYNYNVTVTTVTQAPPLTGSQNLVWPDLPVISNNETHGNRIVVVREGQPVTLQCISRNGVPQSTLAWYRDSTTTAALKQEDTDVLTYQMTPTRQDDRVIFLCRSWYPHAETACSVPKLITAVDLNVMFAPLNVTISGNRAIVANGVDSLDLTCTSGTSKPASNITWDVSGVASSAVGPDQDLFGDCCGTRRQSVRRLTPTRHDDGKTISCSASNPINAASPQTDQVILDLSYKPLIEHIEDTVTVEGHTATLQCNASSKPPSTFTWKRGTAKVDWGTGTSGNNKHDYVIQDVKRTQDGNYTCIASNGAGPADTRPAQLTVYYPPEISVKTSANIFKQSLRLQIDCMATTGKPANYSYKGFTQTWRGTTIRTYPGNSMNISSLSLEHSGTYTCVANNGVPDRAGTVDQSGSKDIIVEVQPKILAQGNRFNWSPGKSFNITVPFYSYPNHTSVQIKRRGTSISSDRRVTVDTVPATVTYRFYGINVSLDGHFMRLEISTLTENDFSNYTLEIDNDIGTSVWPFSIRNRSVPDMPRQISSPGTFTTPLWIWQGEFNGGYEQTFIVEVSPVGKEEWTEKVSIKEGDTNHMLSNGLYYTEIRDLDPGVYLSRIYSVNKLGKSAYSTLPSTFAVLAAECQVSSGAIAGSVVAGIEALIIVVLVVLLYRLRKSNNKETEKQKKETQRKDRSDKIQLVKTRVSTHLYDYEEPSAATINDKGETKTNVYEKLDPAMKTDGAYDAVDTANATMDEKSCETNTTGRRLTVASQTPNTSCCEEKRTVNVNPDYINLEL